MKKAKLMRRQKATRKKEREETRPINRRRRRNPMGRRAFLKGEENGGEDFFQPIVVFTFDGDRTQLAESENRNTGR